MLLVNLLAVLFILNGANGQDDESCITVNLELGTCAKLQDCSELKNVYTAKPRNRTIIEYLVNSYRICGTRLAVRDPIVCCKTRLPIKQFESNGCGVPRHKSARNREVTKVNRWPWVALIGYTDPNGELSFKCDGSLITERNVLTAAHCVLYDLTTVRLGEHDLRTDNETTHIDVPVINIITHPNYDERDGNRDIAILVLAHDILFSQEILPICLPLSEPLKTKNFESYNPFIAGWNYTQDDPSAKHVLQDFQMPILTNDKCVGKFNNEFTNDVICAGYSSWKQYICQGHSGGPLMIPNRGSDGEIYYYQIGILTSNYGCKDPKAPNLFTKVTSFVDWINEQVAKPI